MTPQPPQDPSDRVNFSGTAIGPAGAGIDSHQLVEWQMLGDVHGMMSARGAPAHELAQLNARTDSAVAFLRRLVADGLLPTPPSSLCGLIERFHPVLRRGSDPLRVELLACEFLGALGVPAPGPQEADGAASQPLERAMACPPCPIEPDQIRDVRDYLPLLRQRVELLPSGDATPVRIPPSKRAAAVQPAPTRNDRRTP